MGKINYATPAEIEEVFVDARKAFDSWSQKSIKERLYYMKEIRELLVGKMDYIINKISYDTGKVRTEALMSDLLPVLELIKYYEKNAEKILGERSKKTPIYYWRNRAYLQYSPLGVIAVISPWNYPLQLALIPTLTAVIAGNAVVLKPSELTPLVGELIREFLLETSLPENVVQIVQGEKKEVEKIIEEGPDKIFFTGSTATGKKIMKKAADKMIPVQLELGGKDPMIVTADANFERAVQAAVYGAFSNSGQLCVSIERLYIQEKIYDDFVEEVKEKTLKLRFEGEYDAELGPIIHPELIGMIKKQVKDALKKGAELLTELKEEGNYLHPILLKDTDHKMLVMQEESFGPILPMMKYKSIEEAVALANDCRYGLNASVWSENLNKAKDIASRLETGNCYINDVVKNIGNPHLPFGGIKDSGYGKYHGEAGLKNFSHEKAVMVNKSRFSREVNWFPYSHRKYQTVKYMIKSLFSGDSYLQKIKYLLKIIPYLWSGEDD
ncbi:MAG: aldehyde dehydrogenase family protein [Halanaerobiales bacterium]